MELNSKLAILPYPGTMLASARAAKHASSGASVALFSAGQPHLPPPAMVLAAMHASLDIELPLRYAQAEGLPELRTAVAEEFTALTGINGSAFDVLITCGARHALAQIFYALICPGDEVLISAPYWPGFPDIARAFGAHCVIVSGNQYNSYKIDGRKLSDALSSKTKIVVINSPVNPTGAVYSDSELGDLYDTLKAHSYQGAVISDEVYRSMVYKKISYPSVAVTMKDIPTLTVSSWSKSYSIPGSRVGSLIGPRELIGLISRYQAQTVTPAITGQLGAYASFGDKGHFPKTLADMCETNWQCAARMFTQQLPRLQLFEPEAGIFLFVAFDSYCQDSSGNEVLLADPQTLFDRLLENHGIAVTPGGEFGVKYAFRICLSMPPYDFENALVKLIAALIELLGE